MTPIAPKDLQENQKSATTLPKAPLFAEKMQSNLTVQSETEGNPSQLAAIEDVLALRGPNSPARDGVISPSSCDSDTVYHQTAKVTNKSTASDLEARLLQETGFPLTEPGSESRPAEAKDLGRKTESPRDLYASKSDLS